MSLRRPTDARVAALANRYQLSGGEACVLGALLTWVVATPSQLWDALEAAGSHCTRSGKMLHVLINGVRKKLARVATITTTRTSGGEGGQGRPALSYSLVPVDHSRLMRLADVELRRAHNGGGRAP